MLNTNYQGRFCEENVDECNSRVGNPCKNGGTCTDLDGDYECSCVNGFMGKNCEEDFDDCKNNQCSAGSVCKDKGPGKYECICQPGRIGKCFFLIFLFNANLSARIFDFYMEQLLI